MNKLLTFIFIFFSCAGHSVHGQAVARDGLRSGFTNPPASAKARTWWHWVNGNVTKEAITTDLEAMKQQGIQGVTLFNVDMGFQNSEMEFLDTEWLELFRFAVEEAKRLGMEFNFFNSAGWSTTGGPWITPETTMQTVVWSEVACEGEKTFRGKLAQPFTRLGYYRDIAVLAFPRPKTVRGIDDLDYKSLSIIAAFTFRSHVQPDAKQVEPSAVLRKEDIRDLSSKMTADGFLEWGVPAGDWVILRVGHTPTGRTIFPPIQGGGGLECDKMSRTVVDTHWKNAVGPILDQVGDRVGSTVISVFQDSYEAGCGNWTKGFDKAFKQKRGYDCLPYLPVLAGYYIDGGEISERFLWDFRRTVGDLVAENYYGRLSELCHENGLQFAVEPYGGPFESLQAGSFGDFFISEFWVHNKFYMDSPKYVASMAHLSGKNIVGAESFTNYGGLKNHPGLLKPIGDKAWTEGINRLIFHTYVHQPWNVGPGLTLGKYGMDFNRLNTWWKQGRPYIEYVSRSQFLLQQGRFVADVLVFAGEESPNNPLRRPDIKSLGYDYDFIGSDKMFSLTVKDGLVCTPAGGSYRVLVLPETTWMTPGLLRKINELVKAGAVIIGPKPRKSPSLTGFPGCDAEVGRWADHLWDSKRIKEITLQEAVETIHLPPDFAPGIPDRNLHFIHRKTDNADIYFVATGYNAHSRRVCRFRVTGKLPEIWDPKNGKQEEAAAWRENEDGTTSVSISFEPEGSVFVVFQKPAPATHVVRAEVEYTPRVSRPLPGLEIIRASYQVPMPERLSDVTQVLRDQVRDGKIDVLINTGLFSYDPSPRVAKEARVEYETGGIVRQVSVGENQRLSIRANDGDGLKILGATYGKYAQWFDTMPRLYPVYDVKEHIANRIANGEYLITVDDNLMGREAEFFSPPRELHVIYSTGGEEIEKFVSHGNELNLAVDMPEARLLLEGDKKSWVTPFPGKFSYVTSSGERKSIRVKRVPSPIELAGSWEVSFVDGRGAPAKEVFDELISWTDSPDEGIRYYSGTAIYRKRFMLGKDILKAGHLELDLGRVQVIAEVILNGKNRGILWKAPFRVDLGDAARAGNNELEIRVTNLWPNRLIGDERYPEDYERSGYLVKAWPAWLLDARERPTKRVTFTTWKHWSADSPLLPSGLIGPVIIRPYVHARVK
ncbi:MAG: hypothetical protein LBP56_04550 [Odoribacteraceae bacterium]|nr:hypothetical protein [Odoribacteraceae bacterium]